MQKQVLETKDLILSKAKMSDLNDIFVNFWSQEDTAKYMLWKPCKNLDEAKIALKNIIKFQQTRFAYFVREKSTGKAIGIAGIAEIEPGVFENCGIGLGRQFVGKGYGKQILMTLIDFAKNELKAKKMICSCFRENIPSARMQKSCGFVFSHSENRLRAWDGKEFVEDYYELSFN